MRQRLRAGAAVGRAALSVTALSMLMSATLPNASVAASGDYFQGKTIRIVVAFPVGGDIDSLSRLMAIQLSKKIPGQPTVIVENKPGAGGALALNYLYNVSQPDGLTILGMGSTSVLDQVLRTPSVNYDLTRFEYVGSAGPILQMLATRENSDLKTVADFNKAGRRVAIAGGGASSTSTIIARVLKRQYPNVNVTVGYLGESDRFKALLMEEADAALVGSSYLRTDKAGLRPLVWLHGKAQGPVDAPSLEDLDLVPSTRAFVKVLTAPSQYGRAYLAPPRTPRELMAPLQNAFQATITDPEFLKLAARIGADYLEWQSPQQTRDAYSMVLATPPDAVRGLNELLGAQ